MQTERFAGRRGSDWLLRAAGLKAMLKPWQAPQDLPCSMSFMVEDFRPAPAVTIVPWQSLQAYPLAVWLRWLNRTLPTSAGRSYLIPLVAGWHLSQPAVTGNAADPSWQAPQEAPLSISAMVTRRLSEPGR